MYTCITLGPALVFLGLAENVRNRAAAIFSVFGSVPFFYYVVHIYLIHIITVIAFFISGFGSKDIVNPDLPFFFRPIQFGYPLRGVYTIWIILIITLYPLCKWYKGYKSTHHQWWLSYL